jgi:hypothetical protein
MICQQSNIPAVIHVAQINNDVSSISTSDMRSDSLATNITDSCIGSENGTKRGRVVGSTINNQYSYKQKKIKAINDISLNYFNREVNEKKLFF